MTVLIIDQFSEPSPYDLQRRPEQFTALVDRKLAEPPKPWNTPRIVEVTGEYQLPWASTAYRADENGMAVLWRSRWDSSG